MYDSSHLQQCYSVREYRRAQIATALVTSCALKLNLDREIKL